MRNYKESKLEFINRIDEILRDIYHTKFTEFSTESKAEMSKHCYIDESDFSKIINGERCYPEDKINEVLVYFHILFEEITSNVLTVEDIKELMVKRKDWHVENLDDLLRLVIMNGK